jgi:hypothetical protein
MPSLVKTISLSVRLSMPSLVKTRSRIGLRHHLFVSTDSRCLQRETSSIPFIVSIQTEIEETKINMNYNR